MWQVTATDQVEWAGKHKVKTAQAICAMVLTTVLAIAIDRPEQSIFQQWQYYAATAINVVIYLVAMRTLVKDKERDSAKAGKSPGRYGPKLMVALILGSLGLQEARAFDPRLLRPPQPVNTNIVKPQGASIGVGIVVIIGGTWMTIWLARKCQKWFGPNGTNKLDGRFDREFGMIEDSISPGGTCARLSDVSLDPEETMFEVELELNAEGHAAVGKVGIVPRVTLVTGPEFQAQLSERTGITGLGGQRGDPHYSGPGGENGYFESPIYRDYDGSIVVLEPDQWYYPADVVTVERSDGAEGPWEPVFAARIPRENRIRFYDSSEGGRQYYRVTAGQQ